MTGPGSGRWSGLSPASPRTVSSFVPESADFEVPFVDDLVPVVDIEAGYVEIVDLPGLIEP